VLSSKAGRGVDGVKRESNSQSPVLLAFLLGLFMAARYKLEDSSPGPVTG
jgi:hypothetical protein